MESVNNEVRQYFPLSIWKTQREAATLVGGPEGVMGWGSRDKGWTPESKGREDRTWLASVQLDIKGGRGQTQGGRSQQLEPRKMENPVCKGIWFWGARGWILKGGFSPVRCYVFFTEIFLKSIRLTYLKSKKYCSTTNSLHFQSKPHAHCCCYFY